MSEEQSLCATLVYKQVLRTAVTNRPYQHEVIWV